LELTVNTRSPVTAGLIASVAFVLLTTPTIGFACGSEKGTSKDDTHHAHATTKGELVGKNCAYTTGKMAQRVVAEGSDWTFVGALTPTENVSTARVATPFAVGPDASELLIVNDLLTEIAEKGQHSARLSLTGKKLVVGDTTYVVITSYGSANS
jgi:hypothetical protein